VGRYFFDSSALAKLYQPEAGSDRVEAIFRQPQRRLRWRRMPSGWNRIPMEDRFTVGPEPCGGHGLQKLLLTVEQACKAFENDAKARGLREPTLKKYRVVFKQLRSLSRTGSGSSKNAIWRCCADSGNRGPTAEYRRWRNWNGAGRLPVSLMRAAGSMKIRPGTSRTRRSPIRPPCPLHRRRRLQSLRPATVCQLRQNGRRKRPARTGPCAPATLQRYENRRRRHLPG